MAILFTTQQYIRDDNVLLFDLDGTLVETDYANFLAYRQAFLVVANKDIVYNPNLRFTRRIIERNFSFLTKKEISTIIETKENVYQHFLSETKLNKDVVDILLAYSKTNKCVLVTNCTMKRATTLLNYHGLANCFFDIISHNDELSENKYTVAIRSLGTKPEMLVVYEDTEKEICHAKILGIQKINPIPFRK